VHHLTLSTLPRSAEQQALNVLNGLSHGQPLPLLLLPPITLNMCV